MPHVDFPNLSVLTHPLIQHKLTILRDERTGTRDFKQLVSEIAMHGDAGDRLFGTCR